MQEFIVSIWICVQKTFLFFSNQHMWNRSGSSNLFQCAQRQVFYVLIISLTMPVWYKHIRSKVRVDGVWKRFVFLLPSRQYDLRENSKHSEVLIDLTEFCGQLAEAKCLAVNPRDNNYLAVGANGPFVRLYDIRMIHNYRWVATDVLPDLTHVQNWNKSKFCSLLRKSLSQNTSAAVHTFCDRQKPIPDGAGQYYVAGEYRAKLSRIKMFDL